MKQLIKLYFLELKNAFIRMTKAMGILFFMALILVSSLFFVLDSTSNENKEGLFNIGIVSGQEMENQGLGADIFSRLISFGNNMEGINSFLHIDSIPNMEQGVAKLKSGEILMLMVFPSDFISKAAHMQETEFTVYVNKNGNELTYANTTVLSLIESIENLMMSTEGAIMAGYFGRENFEFSQSIGDMENGIFMMFISRFLERKDFFKVSFLSQFGTYNVIQYYLISIFVMLSMFLGIAFLGMYGKNERRVSSMMSKGIGLKCLTAAARVFVIGVAIFVFEIVMTMIMSVVVPRYLGEPFGFNGQVVCVLGIISLTVASFVNLLATIIERKEERITVYILLVLILLLVSGCVGSIYYLPDFLRKIVSVWPTTQMRQLLMGSLWKGFDNKMLKGILITDLIMMLVGGGLYVKRLNAHE